MQPLDPLLVYLINIPVLGALFSWLYIYRVLRSRKKPASLGGITSFANYRNFLAVVAAEPISNQKVRLKAVFIFHCICVVAMIGIFIGLIIHL